MAYYNEKKYTREYIIKLANEYNTFTEFRKNHKKAYENMKREGLTKLDLFPDSLTNVDALKRTDNVVYGYFDYENKVCYIGRTFNMKHRHTEHNGLLKHYNRYDTVKSYFVSIGKELPLYDILEENLSTNDSLEKEEYYVNKFREEGWKILNKGNLGVKSGSIGGCYQKWTKEKCFGVAKEFDTAADFRKTYGGAYDYMKRNNMLDELIKYMEWDFNYKAREYGKLSNINKLKNKTHFYTEDEVIEISKNYKSKTSFKENANGAFRYAQKHNLLDKMSWLNKYLEQYDEWHNKRVAEVIENSKQYISQTSFKKNNKKDYEFAKSNKLFDRMPWLNKWKENVSEEYLKKYQEGLERYYGKDNNS